MINSTLAKKYLGYKHIWSFKKTILETVKWYEYFYAGHSAYNLCVKNINDSLLNIKKNDFSYRSRWICRCQYCSKVK